MYMYLVFQKIDNLIAQQQHQECINESKNHSLSFTLFQQCAWPEIY